MLINARSVSTHIFEEGGGGDAHCQEGGRTLFHAVLFDWIETRFGSDEHARVPGKAS